MPDYSGAVSNSPRSSLVYPILTCCGPASPAALADFDQASGRYNFLSARPEPRNNLFVRFWFGNLILNAINIEERPEGHPDPLVPT
jgi:hypothetical protein